MNYPTTCPQTTIGELLREHLVIVERTMSPNTVRAYREVCIAHLFEQWDMTPVCELTPAALRAWIITFNCKATTMRLILQPLRNVLVQAEAERIIESKPLENIKLNELMTSKQQKSDFETAPFNMGEIVAILKNADGREKNIFQFSFASGLRMSDCMALKWECIDWQNNTIRV
jgi:integrase